MTARTVFHITASSFSKAEKYARKHDIDPDDWVFHLLPDGDKGLVCSPRPVKT